ncbi:hypothetical protein AMATHDRAFT_65550, partial [Amanita thiersii Skay4041]
TEPEVRINTCSRLGLFQLSQGAHGERVSRVMDHELFTGQKNHNKAPHETFIKETRKVQNKEDR